MTEKISLEEAKKLATNSLLYADGSDLYDRDGDRLFVSTDFDKPSHDKETATAVLLAHCWNTHDELVEELEGVLEWLKTGKVDGVGYDDAAAALSVEAVLARAHTVEMP